MGINFYMALQYSKININADLRAFGISSRCRRDLLLLIGRLEYGDGYEGGNGNNLRWVVCKENSLRPHIFFSWDSMFVSENMFCSVPEKTGPCFYVLLTPFQEWNSSRACFCGHFPFLHGYPASSPSFQTHYTETCHCHRISHAEVFAETAFNGG